MGGSAEGDLWDRLETGDRWRGIPYLFPLVLSRHLLARCSRWGLKSLKTVCALEWLGGLHLVFHRVVAK